MRRALSPAAATTGIDCQASGARVGEAEGVGESVADGLALGAAVESSAVGRISEVGVRLCWIPAGASVFSTGGNVVSAPAQAARTKNKIQAKGTVRVFILLFFFNPRRKKGIEAGNCNPTDRRIKGTISQSEKMVV